VSVDNVVLVRHRSSVALGTDKVRFADAARQGDSGTGHGLRVVGVSVVGVSVVGVSVVGVSVVGVSDLAR
jgi:hypothetical protein